MHHRSSPFSAVLKSVVSRRYLVQIAVAGLFAILLAAGFTTNVAMAAQGELSPEMYCKGYYYVVQKGDTLSEIAKYHGTTVHALAYANHISNPNRIYKGMKLCIVGHGYKDDYKKDDYYKDVHYKKDDYKKDDYKDVHYKDDYYKKDHGYYYIVKKGDTLSEIAKYHGISLHKLAHINHISNPNRIYKGMKLYIP